MIVGSESQGIARKGGRSPATGSDACVSVQASDDLVSWRELSGVTLTATGYHFADQSGRAAHGAPVLPRCGTLPQECRLSDWREHEDVHTGLQVSCLVVGSKVRRLAGRALIRQRSWRTRDAGYERRESESRCLSQREEQGSFLTPDPVPSQPGRSLSFGLAGLMTGYENEFLRVLFHTGSLPRVESIGRGRLCCCNPERRGLVCGNDPQGSLTRASSTHSGTPECG